MKTTKDDADVSPMAAQNTGPERTGPAEEPLRRETPGAEAKPGERGAERIRPGGEAASRDDL